MERLRPRYTVAPK